MSNIRQLSRRDFLKTGGVLVVGVSLYGCGREDKPMPTYSLSIDPWSPDVYVSFDQDGTVNIISHRSEMGQGIRTGLCQIRKPEHRWFVVRAGLYATHAGSWRHRAPDAGTIGGRAMGC